MGERLGIKALVEKYGTPLTDDQCGKVVDFIERTTLIVDGKVVAPGLNSPEYVSMRADILNDQEVQRVVENIFKSPNGSLPPKIFVLTEEQTDYPCNVASFPWQAFTGELVPYIVNQGIANYWATDGNHATATFLDDGVIYWKKS